MTKLLRIACTGLLALSLVACGKTEDEKAQDKMKQRLAEHSALVKELSNSPTPTPEWTDEQINTYSTKVERMDALEKELRGMNGKNNIVISGGDNTAFIAKRREEVKYARAEKARRATIKQNVDKYYALDKENKSTLDKLYLVGKPSESWTEVQLKDFIATADKVTGNCQVQKTILEQQPDSFTDTWKLKVQANDMYASVGMDRDAAKKFLDKKQINPDTSKMTGTGKK
jgi:hypothetical protein